MSCTSTGYPTSTCETKAKRARPEEGESAADMAVCAPALTLSLSPPDLSFAAGVGEDQQSCIAFPSVIFYARGDRMHAWLCAVACLSASDAPTSLCLRRDATGGAHWSGGA
mmetsp:Transcript_14472/g.23812  ORF Transcript_14472/g.23812 Transcript_14472/m.23812 type:complete len:111 (-) Transcript_14472:12-344(-)